MSSLVPLSELDTRERRWPTALTVLPYLMLAFCVALTVVIQGSHKRALIVDLVLSALVAGWMLGMFTLHPGWRDRPRRMAVFYAGLVVLSAALVIMAPWFGFFTFTLSFFAFRILIWPWRMYGMIAVAFLAGTSQAYGVNKDTPLGVLLYIAVLGVNVLVFTAYTWARWNSAVLDQRRQAAMDELSQANHRLEATLAENAGLHQQLLTQAREAGILDERQRMAREIHDTLAQGLTGIITQLQAAEHAIEDPAAWRRHFDAATRLARDSLSEARRSVHELRPELLETARLSDALADVAGRWSELHGIPVQVTTTGTVLPMRPEAEVALLRTAQEALANVAKHAHATRVGVTLSYLDNEVALDVRDDGQGFDPHQLCPDAAGRGAATGSANGSPAPAAGEPASGGFGLVAMRQRIEGLSGTLQVESEPGFGTGISACVPAAPAEAPA